MENRFALSFVNYKKGCTRLAAARDKVYQLLVQGRWFSPGIPASVFHLRLDIRVTPEIQLDFSDELMSITHRRRRPVFTNKWCNVKCCILHVYLVIFHLLSIILYIYLSFFTFNLPIRSYENYYHSRIYTSLNDMNLQQEQDFQRHMQWFLLCFRNGGDKWLFVFCDIGEIGYHHYFFSS
jgi:hypothetical protein